MAGKLFLQALVSELKDELRLVLTNDEQSQISRLQAEYLFLDLDASWCAVIAPSQQEPFIARLRRHLEIGPDVNLDLSAGWTGTRAQGALILRAARDCQIKTQRASTMLSARGTAKHEWKRRVLHLKQAKRMRHLRAAAVKINIYNEARLQECHEFIEDLIACADELYLDTSEEADTGSIELYALARLPASITAMSNLLAAGRRIGQLALPTGGGFAFFSDSSSRPEAGGIVFTLTLTTHHRRQTAYLAADVLAGLEEIWARLHALSPVPDTIRQAHRRSLEEFWHRLATA